MNVVLWVLGAVAGGVVAEEFLGWVTPACHAVLRRGARRLPGVWQGRYTEEWHAELLALPEAAMTRMLWTARTLLGVRSLRATLAENLGGTQLDRSGVNADLSLLPASPHAAGAPTVLRIALGDQLRRLREECGIALDDAGLVIRSTSARLSRLERGQIGMKDRDLLDLLNLYGVTDTHDIEAFQRLAWQANNPGWWQQYADVPAWLASTYVSLEQSASLIRSYECQYVPGLLQTPDYIRAVAMLGHPWSTAELDRAVEMRMRRQQLLTREDTPVRLWTVIDEAVLRRPLGGAKVMRAQIEHLIEVSERRNVTVQVLPLYGGGHAARGAFTVLQLPQSDLPNIVYIEQLTSALYLDKRSDIDHYLTVMDQITVQAVPPSSARDVLRRVLADLA